MAGTYNASGRTDGDELGALAAVAAQYANRTTWTVVLFKNTKNVVLLQVRNGGSVDDVAQGKNWEAANVVATILIYDPRGQDVDRTADHVRERLQSRPKPDGICVGLSHYEGDRQALEAALGEIATDLRTYVVARDGTVGTPYGRRPPPGQ